MMDRACLHCWLMSSDSGTVRVLKMLSGTKLEKYKQLWTKGHPRNGNVMRRAAQVAASNHSHGRRWGSPHSHRAPGITPPGAVRKTAGFYLGRRVMPGTPIKGSVRDPGSRVMSGVPGHRFCPGLRITGSVRGPGSRVLQGTSDAKGGRLEVQSITGSPRNQ
jgi:hypothetical protein